MASGLSSLSFGSSPLQSSPKINLRARNPLRGLSLSVRAQGSSDNSDGGRRIWRRRKLTKRDEKIEYKMERVPFLEEQTRKIKETGKLMTMDIHKLLLSEENRYDFVNNVAEEAKEYVNNNPDEYGLEKKAIMQVISNRMNDSGISRPEAYYEPDKYKPPGYLKDELM